MKNNELNPSKFNDEEYRALKTQEEKDKYFNEKSMLSLLEYMDEFTDEFFTSKTKEQKLQLLKNLYASDMFGLDADDRYFEVDHILTTIHVRFSEYKKECKSGNIKDDYTPKDWHKRHHEIKHSLWKKTGDDYKNGLFELNEIIRITEEKTAELRNRNI
ncbi:MAG: hypothetical protein RLZZ175_1510 [Bacteroidota bacterium]|jgi:peroxiredoxin family protein